MGGRVGNTGAVPSQPALLEESARPAKRARSPLQGGGVVGLVLGRPGRTRVRSPDHPLRTLQVLRGPLRCQAC